MPPPPRQRPTPLRVVMLPYNHHVPYQSSLKRELEALGVRVTAGGAYRWSFLGDISPSQMDVLHLHWLHPLVQGAGLLRFLVRSAKLVGNLLFLRAIGKRLVWTVHNLHPHEDQHPRLDWILRLIVSRLVHAMIVHCQVARRGVLRRFYLSNGDRIHVISQGNYIDAYPNHVSPAQARQALSLPPEARVLLFLGNVRPYKGVLELVQAFKTIAQSDARLVIAGRTFDPAEEQAVHQAIADDPAIQFHSGFVPDDRIQTYMNAADVVVLPYRDILTSAAAMLAISFGRPCIAPRIGCLEETLTDRGGFLYDPADPRGLENALRQAMESPQRLAAMGQYNHQAALQWGWDRIAAATLGVYDPAPGEP